MKVQLQALLKAPQQKNANKNKKQSKIWMKNWTAVSHKNNQLNLFILN